MTKLTDSMHAAMRELLDGRFLPHHSTLGALRRRGLIDSRNGFTAEGWAHLGIEAPRYSVGDVVTHDGKPGAITSYLRHAEGYGHTYLWTADSESLSAGLHEYQVDAENRIELDAEPVEMTEDGDDVAEDQTGPVDESNTDTWATDRDGYEWREVTDGELHYFAPDGRDLSVALSTDPEGLQMAVEPSSEVPTVYGKPVTDVQLTDDIQAECEIGPESGAYGVIVHRAWQGPMLRRCTSAEYRDNTLVPFHAYYTSVMQVETFGPDIANGLDYARRTGVLSLTIAS